MCKQSHTHTPARKDTRTFSNSISSRRALSHTHTIRTPSRWCQKRNWYTSHNFVSDYTRLTMFCFGSLTLFLFLSLITINSLSGSIVHRVFVCFGLPAYSDMLLLLRRARYFDWLIFNSNKYVFTYNLNQSNINRDFVWMCNLNFP